MLSDMTRREFVSTLAVGVLTASPLPAAVAGDNQYDNDFSFLLLGDTHFDRIEHHDLEWMKQHFAKDIRQVENYCRLTTESLPGLLAAALTRLQKTTSRAAFALHVGDLVEGICGNKELATRHCVEGWDFFKQAGLNVPLLMTKGNHDVTGPGALDAYNEVLLQKTAQELGRDQLDRSSYSFRQGDNLFAIFDSYDTSAIDWLEQLVAENSFQRLFVMLHLPVVPYNARSNWRVYYHARHAERRQRLLDLLGRHRAIVLCGHLHKYSLLVRRCKTGKFAQLAISSIHKRSAGTAALQFDSADDYGPDLTTLEPNFSKNTLQLRQQVLAAEQPSIEHFEYSDTSGFSILSVSENDVVADIYNDSKTAPAWRTVSLGALLG